MNRADLLYSVLKDGRTYSRREIQQRVGYFLTNNAASELRKRGFDVVHSKAGGIDSYSLRGVSGPEGTSSETPRSEDGTLPREIGLGLTANDPSASLLLTAGPGATSRDPLGPAVSEQMTLDEGVAA